MDPENTVDDLLASAKVILVVGPGGVGKTTTAAAMAARAAIHHGRRALVVTIDPAKRLAQALGTDSLWEEAVLVPTSNGRLWAQMVDMSRSWDELVKSSAPTLKIQDELLANPLYRSLTTRFVQSHDYIALDHLVDLADSDQHDLVVIDTPPSIHALDVLDAPARMQEFFSSRLLRWLTSAYRSRLVQATAKPFLSIAERILGGPFLADIAEFFWLFSHLQPTFARRTAEVQRRLSDPSTRYVLVQTPEAGPAAQAAELASGLAQRHHEAAFVIVNRWLPTELADINNTEIDRLDSEALRVAIRSLRTAARAGVSGPNGLPEVRVPFQRDALTSVEKLAELVVPRP